VKRTSYEAPYQLPKAFRKTVCNLASASWLLVPNSAFGFRRTVVSMRCACLLPRCSHAPCILGLVYMSASDSRMLYWSLAIQQLGDLWPAKRSSFHGLGITREITNELIGTTDFLETNLYLPITPLPYYCCCCRCCCCCCCCYYY
jgi:hypothetical protein